MQPRLVYLIKTIGSIFGNKSYKGIAIKMNVNENAISFVAIEYFSFSINQK